MADLGFATWRIVRFDFPLENVHISFHPIEIEQLLEFMAGAGGGPPRHRPSAENLLDTLPSAEPNFENPETCSVCQNDIITQDAVQLPCCHHYHKDCLKPWLEEHNTCPTCRYKPHH